MNQQEIPRGNDGRFIPRSERDAATRLRDYFWHYARRSAGCWEWMGPKDRDGYGTVRLQEKRTFAHRVAYELTYGPIPPGLFVIHRCDSPACVNPAHLFLGTPQDRVDLAMEKGHAVGAGAPRDRIMARVEISEGGCWIWQGKTAGSGYGTISVKNAQHYVHRLMWQLTNGPIPEGLFILHHCDNPPCCNPEHLFIGTAKDNTRDMTQKGRDRGRFQSRNA